MYTLETRHITGADVQRIRAALNLLRAEFAAVLGLHRATVIRWESRGREPLRIVGLPADLLAALHQIILVQELPLEMAREHGRHVRNALLCHGRLAALHELAVLAQQARRWRYV